MRHEGILIDHEMRSVQTAEITIILGDHRLLTDPIYPSRFVIDVAAAERHAETMMIPYESCVVHNLGIGNDIGYEWTEDTGDIAEQMFNIPSGTLNGETYFSGGIKQALGLADLHKRMSDLRIPCVIRNPEAKLHPPAIADLFDHLSAAHLNNYFNQSLIIETTSDALIWRLTRRIREKPERMQQYAIYQIDAGEPGNVKLSYVPTYEDGRLGNEISDQIIRRETIELLGD